ncbi:MAG: hypothetical protein K6E91_06135 [Butyrivibrio sp.]|nr:hypothetical protein [Butyrivibrio sp.]
MGYINYMDDRCLDEYVDILGKNMAENIEREYFSAMAYCDDRDEAEGALVYRLCDVDSIDDVKSELMFFEAKDNYVANEMLLEYEGRIREEDVKVIFLSWPIFRMRSWSFLRKTDLRLRSGRAWIYA